MAATGTISAPSDKISLLTSQVRHRERNSPWRDQLVTRDMFICLALFDRDDDGVADIILSCDLSLV